jgi:hypothetical protein
MRHVQRAVTIDIFTTRKIQGQWLWYSPGSRVPSAEDAVKDEGKLETDPHDWEDEANESNAGLRLAPGLVELSVEAPDDVWAKCFFKACDYLKTDARFAFGPQDKPVSAVLFQIDNRDDIDRWSDLWPKGFHDSRGLWIATRVFTSLSPTPKAKAVWKFSSPLPGSRFAQADVVWRPSGKPAASLVDIGLEDLESRRPLASTTMERIIEAIAYGTLLFWILAYLDGLDSWDEVLTRTVGGWLARLWREGADINEPGKSLAGLCWSPVETMADVGDVCEFLRKAAHAPKDLDVALSNSNSALERNPTSPVPGWSALGGVLGTNARKGVRRAFRAGMDLDPVERMSELYAYDMTSHVYIDLPAVRLGLPFIQEPQNLTHRHGNELIAVGKGKFVNPFQVYSTSKMRLDVSTSDFFPGHEPAGILRFSPAQSEIVNGEVLRPDEFRVLNTFGGIALKPAGTIDPAMMAATMTFVDRMLGYLTQDNTAQMMWMKKNVAWTIQHPAEKQQVCLVLVGGQGVGKSLWGGYLMGKILGSLAGTADAATLKDDKFFITQFLGKLIVLIDEAKIESISAINQIKKLIRSDRMSGQRKHEHLRDHRVFARLMIAANQADIGFTAAEAADRTFFYILSYDREFKKMLENEFRDWAFSLKPFYAAFIKHFENHEACQHLMRYFMDLECTREELEDLTLSSRSSESVVKSTMSHTRYVSRRIVADARILSDKDLNAWFNTAHVREAIVRVDGKKSKVEAEAVMTEFERTGATEQMRGDWRRFKYGYAKTLKTIGDAHSLKIDPDHEFRPGDWDENPVTSTVDAPDWRGKKKKNSQPNYSPRPHYPDDSSEPFDP